MKTAELRPESVGVAVAIVPDMPGNQPGEWSVYLLNLNDFPIYGILITSKGYGFLNNEKKVTSVIRRFFDDLPAHSYLKIEPIMEDIFGLTNEYWVSYYVNRQVFDKRFIFLPETIQRHNAVNIPLLDRKGVLIT
ncbi:MAG: hypothetical protein N2110_01010 [Flavobacteriales bacterium]|nr:hypothetical protein [Flavobacteriales bacterium]MCX7767589.1 hypothetical protein [Flavobacteriales bacterium]MDW8410239.1 hypothetical protein [Flavobacteriales bacterium]